ncbi:gastrin/cholecystokinin type B receptor-like [Stylophora pistillata]|uniref:gastrin/cholecystokinin type B receptor-like n=1 Tax=Stylophora pistillata TaxID=50429 RepID=UPI000C03D369|nr:gastrin/cholecystokinin type B receptor-like [Stylophora pistillata]XP_022792956.1 gastrin/cholecystokinin type B receptor-like [Stylophora pistillata]XP_022792957.1 gastrin/cholecystokinin type B receptor-like [Stylophora pistillata]XP_022792958.1 gastrin/cholecystokinin type B receptor-like [Stylophora pistillata]XP_022792959.1 gastrin/cholecystokinin type B receptor-like [Stylophora pistillata]
MNSSNGTTPAKQPYTDTEKVVLIVLYVAIFTVALFGNSIGLYVVCFKTTSKKIHNLLIKNLAIADLLMTLTIMPYSVLFMFLEPNQWIGGTLGTVTCKIFFYIIPVSIAASVTTMVIISLDRFWAIYFPLNQAVFHKHKTITAAIWLISLIFTTPYLILYKVFKVGEDFYCAQDWPWADNPIENYLAVRTFHVVLFFLFYPLPLAIITVLNTIIGRRLWFHRIPGSISSSPRTPVELSRRKVVKMLVVIVLAFALCWLPTHVMHYLMFFKQAKIPTLTANLLYWVSHANSAINPLLYIVFNRAFRFAFMNAYVAMVMSPVHAINACAGYISGEQSVPEQQTSQRTVMLCKHAHSFHVSPSGEGAQDNEKVNQDTKL